MAVDERKSDAPEAWPDAAALRELASDGRLVILPDKVEELSGELRASFREDAQGLRVAAKKAGLEPVLAMPDGAKPAQYREHDAILVLSAVISFATSVAGTLVANEIQAWLDRRREQVGQEPTLPTVRYREAVIEGDNVRMLEVEGPAEEVLARLRSGEGDDRSQTPR